MTEALSLGRCEWCDSDVLVTDDRREFGELPNYVWHESCAERNYDMLDSARQIDARTARIRAALAADPTAQSGETRTVR